MFVGRVQSVLYCAQPHHTSFGNAHRQMNIRERQHLIFYCFLFYIIIFLLFLRIVLQGSGWWKYEICYNKYIRQVHKEKGKPDEIVILGLFNMEEHIKWLDRNEEKKPKFDAQSARQVVSHFYSMGSVCANTGEKRETEVNIIIVFSFYVLFR